MDVVEGTIPPLDVLVEFGKLPKKLVAVLPGNVLGPQLLEDLAELEQSLLVPTGVELEWTLHDAAVVEVGDVDDVGVSGILRASFFLVFFSQLCEECTNDSHGLSFDLNNKFDK